MAVPAPLTTILDAVQCFNQKGEEYFLTVVRGRRPDVKDSLRVMGTGKTRAESRANATVEWDAAWATLKYDPPVAAGRDSA